ncbi:hypothetical protein [Methanobrevibacter sp.]|uniref:hypothetical protein n=1 Tax=Methanobrevibacter sp. TaxID=66852 RepID=UPI0026DEFDDD|nr:hypothetical protein [Methanobrevibacter sp.]MDO5859110.1 hypothetical protein [Methanobrevibacter sp.]
MIAINLKIPDIQKHNRTFMSEREISLKLIFLNFKKGFGNSGRQEITINKIRTRFSNMKDILNKYINQDIRIRDNDSSQYHFYPLTGVGDNYFTISNPFDESYDVYNRHIPYTSIREIIETDSAITIELAGHHDAIRKMEDDISTIKEEIFNVKGCIIGNSVPLGEIMRKVKVLDEDTVRERQNSLKSIERNVSALANNTRFYR